MNPKMKQWVAIAALASVALLAGGWFLLVSPKRADAATLRAQAASQQQANQALKTQISVLKAQAKDLPKQQATLAAVAAKIPSNSAMPTLIRALNAAATDTGVELISMAPTAPSPVAAGPAAAGTAAPAGGSTAARVAARPASSAAVGSLQQIGVSLNVVGSYFQVAEYLDRLESLSRAFRVSALTLSPGSNPVKPSVSQPSTDSGKLLTAVITGQVFEATGASAPTTTSGK